MASSAERIAIAAQAIASRWPGASRVAVILGTGLGTLADEISAEAAIPYSDIPGLPRSTALAHKGRLICGRWNGIPLLMLQGRCHAYEGYSFADLVLPVQTLAALGVKTLILTNAAGGLNPNFAVGDVMLIDDHINFMNLYVPFDLPRRTPLYESALAQHAEIAARDHNFPVRRGAYIAVSGPSYETRAEYRAFRRLGGDCVGMSTVPEVLAAAACGMQVLGLSTITNVASPDAPQKVSAEEVVAVAATALPKVRHIIQAIAKLTG